MVPPSSPRPPTSPISRRPRVGDLLRCGLFGEPALTPTADYALAERRRSVVGVIIYARGIGVAVLAPPAVMPLVIASTVVSAAFSALTAGGSHPMMPPHGQE